MSEIEYRHDPEHGLWEIRGVDAPVHSAAMFSAQVSIMRDVDGRIIQLALIADNPHFARNVAILNSSLEHNWEMPPAGAEPPDLETQNEQ